MKDSFYIAAYWGSKAESLQDVSTNILMTLKSLSEIDKQFLNWYERGMGRKKALENKVLLEFKSIERLCRKTVKRNEINEAGYAKNGFVFGLWTGHTDEESSSISFSVGNTFKIESLRNCCVLKIPKEGSAHERLLKPEKAKEIIHILVTAWKPDNVVLTSHGLSDKFNDKNEIGWITYRKSMHFIPKLSNKIIYENFNSGHLFIFSPLKYDIDSCMSEFLHLRSVI